MIQVDGHEFVVEVIDSVSDYLELMKDIFDFGAIRNFLQNFPILINCMNGGNEMRSGKYTVKYAVVFSVFDLKIFNPFKQRFPQVRKVREVRWKLEI